VKICFVDSSRSNPFVRHLFAALETELAALGVETEHEQDGFPRHSAGLVYVVIPNEYYENTVHELHPTSKQLRNTIALSLAPPGLLTAESDYEYGRNCAAMMDVSPVGVVDLWRRGVAAQRLTLGWTAAWDNYDAGRERPIDILSFNSGSRRRELLLGRYAEVLTAHNARIDRPARAHSAARAPDWGLGPGDFELIGSAKLMLNARHQSPEYFDWLLAIQAICSGTLWLTEHGAGQKPLVAGEHFFAASPKNLGLAANALLRDSARISQATTDAYELLRSEMLLATGAQEMAELAELVATGAPPRLGRPLHRIRKPDFTDEITEGDLATHEPEKLHASFAPTVERAELKRKALNKIVSGRKRAHKKAAAAGIDPDASPEIHRSPSYAKAQPRVTVCVPLYNHAHEMEEALASLVNQDYKDFDVLVQDDCSTDNSADTVISFSKKHPELPLRLLRREANAGLPAGRNRMLQIARGEFVLALDADNALYPRCISTLTAALDDDPDALFAYGILEIRDHGKPDGLLSARFWEPEILAHFNPFDALALFRRERLIDFGGYVEEVELFGWEDYDLYCRCAENGEHGVHVPQMLARYRRGEESMLSITNLETDGMYARLEERHPKLFAGRLP
jgi:hypothetical protein